MARDCNPKTACHCRHNPRLTFDWGIKMLKPSKRHFLRYDAQTYETQGFIDLCGIPLKMHNDTTKDQRFSKEPRFWQVTAKAITQNEDATEKRTTFFKFVTDTKITLGELSIVVNGSQQISKRFPKKNPGILQYRD